MLLIGLVIVFAAAYSATYVLLLALRLLVHGGAALTGQHLPAGWFSARRVSVISFLVALLAVALDIYLLSTSPLSRLN